MVVRCDDRPGVVHQVTGAILAVGGNILENAQFTDPDSNTFVMRTRFVSHDEDADAVRSGVRAQLGGDGIDVQLRGEDQFPRVLIMVSKFDHCLLDLLYRHRTGDLSDVRLSMRPNGRPCVWFARAILKLAAEGCDA